MGAEQIAIPRYWMGTTYLLDGINIIPFVIGLFAVPELVNLAVKERAIADRPRAAVAGGLMQGVRDCFIHWWLLLRSSVLVPHSRSRKAACSSAEPSSSACKKSDSSGKVGSVMGSDSNTFALPSRWRHSSGRQGPAKAAQKFADCCN